MQRVRRLGTVVVVASLGVTGLSACQQAPSVAAYLGSLGTISEDQVSAVWDNARDALQKQADAAAAEAKQATKPVVMPITRADVVSTLIGVKLMDQVSADTGVAAKPDAVLQEEATALHLPATSTYMQDYAHWDSIVEQLKAGATSAPDPTDADLQQVFDQLVKYKQVPPGTTFASFKSSLADQNKTLVKVSVAARNQIQKVSDGLHIKVNPRYQPAELPMLSFQTAQDAPLQSLIGLPLGKNDAVAPVTDAS